MVRSVQSPKDWFERKRSMRGDHPNDCIIKIGQSTEKSPRDLRRLAVTYSPLVTYTPANAGVKNFNKNKIIITLSQPNYKTL